MNNVMLIGRLTADPELRFLPNNGTAVTRFTMAVDRNLSRDKKQELEQQGKPTADFPRVTVWGKQAENCATYLSKGRLVAVQGRIQTGTYDNNQGQKVYTTEVVAERVQFLEWGDNNKSNNTQTQNSYNTGGIDTNGFQPVDDDEIPF